MKKAISETFLNTVDSTQLHAKRLFHDTPSFLWRAIIAETQTNGQGQYNRKWHSPPNNLYATFAFPFPAAQLESLPCVTQIAAVSVCQALETFNVKGQIKWKNDVMINRKKICGILAEAENIGENTLVYTGIGVNVNMTDEESKEINQPTTSLKMQLGCDIDKKLVYESIRDKFMINIDVFLEKGFGNFLSYINKNSVSFGKIVKIVEDGYMVKGEFLGLDQRGFMVLKTDTGSLVVVSNGQLIMDEMQK